LTHPRLALLMSAAFAGCVPLELAMIDHGTTFGLDAGMADAESVDAGSVTTPADAGAPDAETPVTVHSLIARWSAGDTVRWGWQAEGDSERLVRYELVVGPTQADVLARSTATTSYTEVERPELGGYFLLRTAGTEPVLSTSSDGHQHLTDVFARLEAVDSSGARLLSNVASARTAPEPAGAVVIFADALLSGYAMPAGFVPGTSAPFAGTTHYEYVHACPSESDCWENLRWNELAIDLDSVEPGAFETTAFLELALAYEGALAAYYMEVGLTFGTTADHTEEFVFRPWTLPADGRYHVVQIPLRALVQGESALTHADLSLGLHSLRLGARWTNGGRVRVDEARIRW